MSRREKMCTFVSFLFPYSLQGVYTHLTCYKRNFQHRCVCDSSEQWHLLLYFIKYVNYKRAQAQSFHVTLLLSFVFSFSLSSFHSLARSFALLQRFLLKQGRKTQKQTNKVTYSSIYQVSQT